MTINRWNRILFSPEGDLPGGGGAGDAPPIAPPIGKTILGGDAGGDKPWYSTLPPEFQTDPYVGQSKDLAGFVKSAIDTKKMVGANVIRLPGDKATPEEISEFHTKLGRPAEASAYTSTVKPVADQLLDPTVMSHMQGEFHKLGLSATQGQGVLDAYLGQLNTGFEATTAQKEANMQQGIATLKTEWGPKYENNVKTAQLAITQYGGQELMAKIDSAGFGNDVDFIKFMHNVGVQLLDDDAIGGDSGGQFSSSPMAAQQEISKMTSDVDFQKALNSASAPGHKEAVERWLSAHRKAFPTTSIE